jgi:hypothetical protein
MERSNQALGATAAFSFYGSLPDTNEKENDNGRRKARTKS